MYIGRSSPLPQRSRSSVNCSVSILDAHVLRFTWMPGFFRQRLTSQLQSTPLTSASVLTSQLSHSNVVLLCAPGHRDTVPYPSPILFSSFESMRFSFTSAIGGSREQCASFVSGLWHPLHPVAETSSLVCRFLSFRRASAVGAPKRLKDFKWLLMYSVVRARRFPKSCLMLKNEVRHVGAIAGLFLIPLSLGL